MSSLHIPPALYNLLNQISNNSFYIPAEYNVSKPSIMPFGVYAVEQTHQPYYFMEIRFI